MELLKIHVSALGCCDQEEAFLQEMTAETGAMGKESIPQPMIPLQLMAQEEKKHSLPDITLKLGGQFIGLKEDINQIFNKEIQHFSCICPIFQHFSTVNKISVIFTKSPNLGNLVVKTKI